MVVHSVGAALWCAIAACACGSPPPVCLDTGGEVALLDTSFGAIALDDTDVYLLAEDGGGGSAIWRIDKTTHLRTKLVSLEGRVWGQLFAVDDSHLFFAEPERNGGPARRLFKMQKGAGGAPEQVVASETSIESLIVDGGDLFFVAGGTLVRVAVAAGDQTVVADGGVERFAVDQSSVFWVQERVLYQSSRSGDDKRELFRPLPSWVGELSIDEDHVYWSNDEGLQRVAKTGGGSQVVVNDVSDDSFAFEVVGAHVYWSSSEGSLWRSPLVLTPGGEPDELLERRGSFDDDDYYPLMAADDHRIYWQAGPNVGERRSDGEPLGLYYRCLQ